MKSKVISVMLVGIALVALSASAAHAGAGGVPIPLTSFFVCDGIKGQDSGQVVDIEGPFIGIPRSAVRIGGAVLSCAVAKLFPSGQPKIPCSPTNSCPAGSGLYCAVSDPVTGAGVCELAPNPSNLDPQAVTYDQLKCYNVAVSPRRTGSPPPSYKVTDQLVGEESGVQDSGIQYVCAPAQFLGQ